MNRTAYAARALLPVPPLGASERRMAGAHKQTRARSAECLPTFQRHSEPSDRAIKSHALRQQRASRSRLTFCCAFF